MSHSPGPWKWQPGGFLVGDDGQTILADTRVEPLHGDRARWEADDRLIAAAPELLFEAESMVIELEGLWDELKAACPPDDTLKGLAKSLHNLKWAIRRAKEGQ